MTYLENTRSLMTVAVGNAPADLVITGGRLFKICEEGYVGFKDGITRGLFADQPAPLERDAMYGK